MRELVHFDNGEVTFSTAVVRVANALSPLAAARDTVAIIGACVVEINQIDVERRRLQAQGQAFTTYLAQRQREVASVFLTQQRIASNVEIDRAQIREALALVVKQSTDSYISEDERLMFLGLIPVLSGQLVEAARQDREGLVQVIEALRIGRYTKAIERW